VQYNIRLNQKPQLTQPQPDYTSS